jgi:hypothetical protein
MPEQLPRASLTVSQQAPLFVGTPVTAEVAVKHIDAARAIVTFDTACKDGAGKTLMAGSARVMLERPKRDASI